MNTTQQIVTEYATMNRLKGGMGTFPSPFSDVVAALETISSLDVFNIVPIMGEILKVSCAS